LLGYLRGEFRRRLMANDVFHARLHAGGLLLLVQGRFAADGAAATLVPLLVPDELERLACGDGNEDVPQVVAVGELWKARAGDAVAETVESAESHVLLVGGPARRLAQLLARQPDEAREIRLPQSLNRRRVSSLQNIDPVRDRSVARHSRFSAT